MLRKRAKFSHRIAVKICYLIFIYFFLSSQDPRQRRLLQAVEGNWWLYISKARRGIPQGKVVRTDFKTNDQFLLCAHPDRFPPQRENVCPPYCFLYSPLKYRRFVTCVAGARVMLGAWCWGINRAVGARRLCQLRAPFAFAVFTIEDEQIVWTDKSS